MAALVRGKICYVKLKSFILSKMDATRLSKMTFSLMTCSLKIMSFMTLLGVLCLSVMLSVVKLNVVLKVVSPKNVIYFN
jgi:hypothetical protein